MLEQQPFQYCVPTLSFSLPEKKKKKDGDDDTHSAKTFIQSFIYACEDGERKWI